MICSKCKEDKPESEFVVDKRWRRGRGYLCKSCRADNDGIGKLGDSVDMLKKALEYLKRYE